MPTRFNLVVLISMGMISSCLFCHCAYVADAAIGSAIDAAVGNPRQPGKDLVVETNGNTVILNKYQIDGDSVYGYKEDFSDYRNAKANISKIEKFRGSGSNHAVSGPDSVQSASASRDARQSRIERQMKNYGLLFLCLASGMAIGGGVGMAIPLTESTNSSTPGMDQFLSAMSGMLGGGLIGFLVYLGIKEVD